MPTPAEILDAVASLQNDTAKTYYTNLACLPYFNMALDELQEHFEDNGVPVVEESSIAITMLQGNTRLGYGTNPKLPYRLLEVKQMWESIAGQQNYFKMQRVEFLPHYAEGVERNYYQFYAQEGEDFVFFPTTGDIDLKIDYLRSLWQTPIPSTDLEVDLNIRGCKSYLQYRTAALCSAFIGENQIRAQELTQLSLDALGRALSIKIKPGQNIVTKRRPFRASYKLRGNLW